MEPETTQPETPIVEETVEETPAEAPMAMTEDTATDEVAQFTYRCGVSGRTTFVPAQHPC